MDENKSNPGTSESVQVDKMKILCLHGYRQNADSFKSKLGSFRKIMNKYAEFVFVTAPHQAPPLEGTPEGADISDQKSWWFNKDDGTFKATNNDGPAYGFEESVKLVEKVWEEKGPFQGLLGFSQGACFVRIICGLSVRGLTTINPTFAIIAAGFASGSLVHKNFYEDPIKIPTLHIYGENDNIIPMKMSHALLEGFKLPCIVHHSGGHYFPVTDKEKPIYIKFIQDRITEHNDLKNEVNSRESATSNITRNSN